MPGLSAAQALEKLHQFGPNVLPEKRGDNPLRIFIRQFHSPFIYMLLAAALISFGLQHVINGIFIFAVLVLNATIGTIQEYSAQRAAAALKKMVPQYAAVIRDGKTCTIDATELVPADLVLLASGDKVPADLQLIECQELLVDESILTGESHAAGKQTGTQIAADAPITEQSGRAFAGTIVNHGRAKGTVIATGAHSQIGLIAAQVSEAEQIKPPLLQRINRFTLIISYSVLVVIALLFVIALMRGDDLATVFLLGVALAVSAIPEGLPAAITVALAIGMRRMSKASVIVRKLVAVESLGSCTYIASDKTGTLTVNEMTAREIILADGRQYHISGEGLNIHGEISDAEGPVTKNAGKDSNLEKLIMAGLLANEASLSHQRSGNDSAANNGEWLGTGDGVDLAFRVLAAKYGFNQERAASLYPMLAQIPYEPDNAYSASINQIEGTLFLFVKGSIERLLPMCSQGADGVPVNTQDINQHMSSLANRGFRVLALGCKALSANNLTADLSQYLHDLNYLGMVAMVDPLRPDAVTAVAECRKAAIDVAMITGDHPQTALALARQLGIADENTAPVNGAQIAAAVAEGQAENKSALSALVNSTRVFARVEPMQKLQIVQQLIDDGHYVAVTGDGVNDAPALHRAHVGIAMGKRGTDVARESSDLIITDDNFASIVGGIRQGRIVYNNIRKVVFLLISTGAAEITLFILSVLLGYPIPLFPVQLLWLNLVTNGIQDVALAFEPAEGNELQQAPRSPSERIFNRLMLERVITNAIVMGVLAFAVFAFCLNQGMNESSARNITLLLMVLFENIHVLNSRSETQSIFKQAFFGNPLLIIGMITAQLVHISAMYTPGLKNVLEVEPVSFTLWLSLLSIASTLIVVDETHKKIHQIRARKKRPAQASQTQSGATDTQ